jgi:hypothetical protein
MMDAVDVDDAMIIHADDKVDNDDKNEDEVDNDEDDDDYDYDNDKPYLRRVILIGIDGFGQKAVVSDQSLLY